MNKRQRVYLLVFAVVLLLAVGVFYITYMNQLTAGQQAQIDAWVGGNNP